MCGITVWYDGSDTIQRISHRGKRIRGQFYNGINFQFTRLPIQGLDERHDQPFDNRREIILFNGEIYNYKEISSELECDTPLWGGNNDFRIFDGMYSVVKYDKLSKKTTVITDRFGKKQLYYRLENGRIVGICSEIKGLVKPNDKMDSFYLSRVFKFGYNFSNDKTLVVGIRRFLPGFVYQIYDGKILSASAVQWDSSKMCPLPELMPFYDMMDLAVKRRLVSDVPVSILFSGGLDSSILLHHALKHQPNIKIFTIENGTDTKYAKRLAKDWNVKIKIIKLKYNQKDYDKIHLANESAVDLGSVIPQYLLFKEIRKAGYDVALSADAADEVFGGYKRMESVDCQTSDIIDELSFYHFPRLDRMSMAHTVELRCPFAAQYIVDAGLRLPYYKRIGKRFLKEVYKTILPSYIIDREKEPLKIKSIRDDKVKAREELAVCWKNKLFKEFVNQ